MLAGDGSTGPFAGGVFHASLDGGRANAALECGPHSLRARLADGRVFELPYRGCDLQPGGTSGRMVFCRSADRALTLYCEDPQFLPALQRAGEAWLGDDVQALIAGSSRRRVHRAGCLLLALGGLAALLVAGWLSIGPATAGLMGRVPIGVDEKIGRTLGPEVLRGQLELDDAEVAAFLRELVGRLDHVAAVPGFAWDVHVVDAPTVNALALPGGFLIIYSGLITTAGSAEEVAAVLAHEMAHVTLRHGLRTVGRALGLAAAVDVVLGDLAGLAALGSQVLRELAERGYSRAQEAEADREGLRMLRDSGIDPVAAVRMFERLAELERDAPAVPQWLATHPDTAVRIAAIRARIDAQEPRDYAPLEMDFAALRARIKAH